MVNWTHELGWHKKNERMRRIFFLDVSLYVAIRGTEPEILE
jgi:hypothetical protein